MYLSTTEFDVYKRSFVGVLKMSTITPTKTPVKRKASVTDPEDVSEAKRKQNAIGTTPSKEFFFHFREICHFDCSPF